MATQLEILQRRMRQIVDDRLLIVKRAECEIAKANREFDRMAIPLAREIQLAGGETIANKPTPIKRTKQAVAPAGLTDDEIQHFNELRNRK